MVSMSLQGTQRTTFIDIEPKILLAFFHVPNPAFTGAERELWVLIVFHDTCVRHQIFYDMVTKTTKFSKFLMREGAARSYSHVCPVPYPECNEKKQISHLKWDCELVTCGGLG